MNVWEKTRGRDSKLLFGIVPGGGWTASPWVTCWGPIRVSGGRDGEGRKRTGARLAGYGDEERRGTGSCC